MTLSTGSGPFGRWRRGGALCYYKSGRTAVREARSAAGGVLVVGEVAANDPYGPSAGEARRDPGIGHHWNFAASESAAPVLTARR
jgi:hypothetical protein